MHYFVGFFQVFILGKELPVFGPQKHVVVLLGCVVVQGLQLLLEAIVADLESLTRSLAYKQLLNETSNLGLEHRLRLCFALLQPGPGAFQLAFQMSLPQGLYVLGVGCELHFL